MPIGFLQTASSRLETELGPRCVRTGSIPHRREQPGSAPGRAAAPSRSPPAKAHDGQSCFSQPVPASDPTRTPSQGSQGMGSTLLQMGRHKAGRSQCQPRALTRALLSTQPLHRTVFSWLLRQSLTQTCQSPLPKEEKRRELVEKKITLYSLEKAGSYETADTARGHGGQ